MSDVAKIKSLAEWPALRREIISAVSDLLGPLPAERAELQVKVVDEVQLPNYTRKRVNYFVDEWTRVSAWLCIPEGKDEVPAILCCHGRVAQGKDEPAGLEGEPRLALAHHYAELGYVTIAPDCVGAGERVSPGLAPFDLANFYKDNPKSSATGKMLVDHMHAVDVLCETKRVDSARIGVAGHGLGGENALFLAAFDPRIQACVISCAFTRFAEDKNPERWYLDDGFVRLPKMKDLTKKKGLSFDLEHLLALVAPNPLLLLTAINDETLSNTKSCDKAVKAAGRIYKLLGEENAIGNFEHRNGHAICEESLFQADEWFERWL